jgi:hypothetical protein
MPALLAAIFFSLRGSTLLAMLLVMVCIAVSFAFYRFTLPPLPPRTRIVLSALRASSLSLLLLLFFEPIMRIVHTDEQAPRVAVLIDNTQSMTIKDNLIDRSSATREWLAKSPFKELHSPAAADYFEFGSKLSAGFSAAPETLSFWSQTTDIAASLSQLKDRLVKDNIQAAVILTDGNYTVGKNPLYEAEGLGIPLYTVGVGDTTEQKDVLVEKVVTNNLAYAETRIPVDVTIKSSGYSDKNVEVTVDEGSVTLDRKVIALQEGTHEYPVQLFVEPKEEGMKKYTANVSRLPGELTDKNNTRSFFIKVLKSKLQILLVAGAPSPDVPAVRQALLEDGHFAVHALVQKNADEFYENRLTQSLLDSADCFVFIGFPTNETSSGTARRLLDAIDKQKKPLLFINGRSVNYAKLTTFESILPFGWSSPNGAEINVFPSMVDRYKYHLLVTLEGAMTLEGWQALPPLFKAQTLFHAKPGADVLARVSVHNIVLDEPLVLIRNLDGQRSLAITGYGVWQWWLSAQGNVQTDRFFPGFMATAVRWLTAKNEDKNVRITPTQQIFTTAEPAEFTAQVYDEQLHPIDDADVRVTMKKGGESTEIELHSTGNGMYSGAAEALTEGDYTYSGGASSGGGSYGEDKGSFTVGQVNVEFIETRMNKPLLEQMAFRSGGKYYDLAGSGNLVSDINRDVRFTVKENVSASEIELWNWQYFLGALIFLFAVEWLARKINGMV